MTVPAAIIHQPGLLHLAHIRHGQDALLLAQLCAQKPAGPIIYLANTHAQAQRLMAQLRFFAPKLDVGYFPDWDCLAYEPRNPDMALQAKRIALLAQLLTAPPAILCTTISASMQRLVPRQYVQANALYLRPKHTRYAQLRQFLTQGGYVRTGLVSAPGEYALRGGLIDMFPAQAAHPLRLDFFGDILQSMVAFDTESQRNLADTNQASYRLTMGTELPWSAQTRAAFQNRYRRQFGVRTKPAFIAEQMAPPDDCPDGLAPYQPLLFERLDSLWDYCAPAYVCLADDGMAQARAHGAHIAQAYTARVAQAKTADTSPPLRPRALYLSYAVWRKTLSALRLRILHVLDAPKPYIDFGGQAPPDFAVARRQGKDVFAALATHIQQAHRQKRSVLLASATPNGATHLRQLMAAHHCDGQIVKTYPALQALQPGQFGIATLDIAHGFRSKTLLLISEEDILGKRSVPSKHRRPTPKQLALLGSFKEGELLVHREHGIGRFEGLQCLTVDGAKHDCLRLCYRDSAILYVPVEHADLLSPYGSGNAELDALGRAAWSARRARVKQRVLEMAQELIAIAAQRNQETIAPNPTPQDMSYQAFCAGFAYEPTADQQAAIRAVEDDLAQTRPMDRLICGDAGYGKTEIALRAAFLTSWNGGQVALLAPTSLLVRQHVENFRQRFQDFPIVIGELSGMQSARAMKTQRAQLQDGTLNIVIGTHALLSHHVRFQDLRLVIIDEEQHFGVRHKEALKALRGTTHVLTLTATPIPRSLQLALGGLRALSLIRQAPAGRLDVLTHIAPFDALGIRDALLREKYRQGQSFFICPRVSDLAKREAFLRTYAPDLTFVCAHGQLPARILEERIARFYAGECDVLLSTSIVESGLDIPRANTIIIDDAQKFGLGQLYQMRGRVGRAQRRAFAYLCYPPQRSLSAGAKTRLQVLSQAAGEGASFALAMQDLELRGGGNLLGAEQSGHIREVGFALYQQMLEEAIQSFKGVPAKDTFTPQLQLGCPALLSENYIPDFDVRLQEYRRLAAIRTQADAQALEEEFRERFGPVPLEASNLLAIVRLKCLCHDAGIARVSAGPKGVQLQFHDDKFANPDALLALVQSNANIKLRPNATIVFSQALPSAQNRLEQTQEIVQNIHELAHTAG